MANKYTDKQLAFKPTKEDMVAALAVKCPDCLVQAGKQCSWRKSTGRNGPSKNSHKSRILDARAATAQISATSATEANKIRENTGRCPPGFTYDEESASCVKNGSTATSKEGKDEKKKAPAVEAKAMRRVLSLFTNGPKDDRHTSLLKMAEDEPDLARAMITMQSRTDKDDGSPDDTVKIAKYLTTLMKKNKSAFKERGVGSSGSDVSMAVDKAMESKKWGDAQEAMRLAQDAISSHAQESFHQGQARKRDEEFQKNYKPSSASVVSASMEAEEAEEASEAALASGNPADHRKAAIAHGDAEYAAKERGDHTAAKGHADKIALHKKAWANGRSSSKEEEAAAAVAKAKKTNKFEDHYAAAQALSALISNHKASGVKSDSSLQKQADQHYADGYYIHINHPDTTVDQVTSLKGPATKKPKVKPSAIAKSIIAKTRVISSSATANATVEASMETKMKSPVLRAKVVAQLNAVADYLEGKTKVLSAAAGPAIKWEVITKPGDSAKLHIGNVFIKYALSNGETKEKSIEIRIDPRDPKNIRVDRLTMGAWEAIDGGTGVKSVKAAKDVAKKWAAAANKQKTLTPKLSASVSAKVIRASGGPAVGQTWQSTNGERKIEKIEAREDKGGAMYAWVSTAGSKSQQIIPVDQIEKHIKGDEANLAYTTKQNEAKTKEADAAANTPVALFSKTLSPAMAAKAVATLEKGITMKNAAGKKEFFKTAALVEHLLKKGFEPHHIEANGKEKEGWGFRLKDDPEMMKLYKLEKGNPHATTTVTLGKLPYLYGQWLVKNKGKVSAAKVSAYFEGDKLFFYKHAGSSYALEWREEDAGVARRLFLKHNVRVDPAKIQKATTPAGTPVLRALVTTQAFLKLKGAKLVSDERFFDEGKVSARKVKAASFYPEMGGKADDTKLFFGRGVHGSTWSIRWLAKDDAKAKAAFKAVNIRIKPENIKSETTKSGAERFAALIKNTAFDKLDDAGYVTTERLLD